MCLTASVAGLWSQSDFSKPVLVVKPSLHKKKIFFPSLFVFSPVVCLPLFSTVTFDYKILLKSLVSLTRIHCLMIYDYVDKYRRSQEKLEIPY